MGIRNNTILDIIRDEFNLYGHDNKTYLAARKTGVNLEDIEQLENYCVDMRKKLTTAKNSTRRVPRTRKK
ncbi:hypothetical protein GGR21_000038 [Dysgonomonas hofstadii]|uniref:Uncharacterized protein n=1 Tax=Dysgonomonas hofstadii TaxID=637886 RepID=A0A840CQW2_9BACT|nr:hypothetical protein [Dysgonomonas hofstadii]MBB4034153.1 hypothetical protein [Dysgonomonas hofstadii]